MGGVYIRVDAGAQSLLLHGKGARWDGRVDDVPCGTRSCLPRENVGNIPFCYD